ncbi:DUF6152 family protein [Bordetella bronchiseptica]|uniref:DUF6152 family protein n=1 Tax=Bordetella bronchiseptica TaxID=518 RepID=UPI000290236B|nr:DUF6152 family protein [Bordetella bronchiseptica]KCV29309.1 hypothetical protein L489_0895 [Bordetella bronchiseptica 00-P-2730]AUL14105.1 hypothetical protein BTL45_04000 [Bordetella bronchiseptica]AWP57196.1 hypothetical protein B7P02_04005 [Bordetella bronchiseptica]KAK50142.1 hypothetical protein L576_0838 [Bordetella bronchiseptica OSU054]KAK69933.1 hypothetical protein L530_0813 [Bordetella bronchiseptica MO211]
MTIRHLLAAGGLAAALAAPAWAHHGWSSYDADQTLTIEAPLTEVRYRNPHAEVKVDYQGASWDVVLAPVSRMESRGLAKDALAVGKTVTIVGYPRKDGTHEVRAERITVDGKTIELR